MNKFKYLFGVVIISASVMPSLQQLSICFSQKSHLFKNTVQKCKKDDQNCILEEFIKVCEFNKTNKKKI